MLQTHKKRSTLIMPCARYAWLKEPRETSENVSYKASAKSMKLTKEMNHSALLSQIKNTKEMNMVNDYLRISFVIDRTFFIEFEYMSSI